MRSGDDPAIPARIDRGESGPDLRNAGTKTVPSTGARRLVFLAVLGKPHPPCFSAFAQDGIDDLRPLRLAPLSPRDDGV